MKFAHLMFKYLSSIFKVQKADEGEENQHTTSLTTESFLSGEVYQ